MNSRTRVTTSLVLLAGFALSKWAPVAAVEPKPEIDTVVVCARRLLPAMKPWIEFRRRQGHEISLISGEDPPAEIRRAIQTLADNSKLRHVVLVGDTSSVDPNDGLSVPTHRAEAHVIRRWGSGPTFATDNWYGDVDEDGVPDLAVGRLSADSESQLTGIVTKILAYEQSQDMGLWRRRINLVAGVGGFGPITDAVLESAAKKIITDGIPPAYRTSMTRASWRSPYAPDPRLFRSQTIERMNEGCLTWIYLGHGRARELDRFRIPGGSLPILDTGDIPKIASRSGSPIAVFLSCHAGAFDLDDDCLAEELLEAPGGPVAVIGSSDITMPYAMTVMGNALLDQMFDVQRQTIGEVLLYAKQELAREPNSGGSLVDKLATAISPHPELLHDERREHVLLFNLIGDPLLRIRQARKVTVHVDEYGTAGEMLSVKGTSELDGPCVIELVCRRDRLTFKPPRRQKFDANERGLQAMQETYVKANDTRWSAQSQRIEGGKFAAELPIPKDAIGPSHVRVYVQGENDFAMGAADVYLRRPERVESTE